MATIMPDLSTTGVPENWTNLKPSTRLATDASICLTLIFSSLSILGGFLIILVYIVVRIDDYRRQIRRFLVYLTLADIMVAGGNLWGTIRFINVHRNGNLTDEEKIKRCHHPDNSCALQSALTTYGTLSSFFWITSIGVHLFLIIRHQCAFTFRIEARVILHIVNWGIPGIVVICAASYDVMGDNFGESTSTWCWIKHCIPSSNLWMVITGISWELLTYITAMFLWVNIKCFMNRAFTAVDTEQFRRPSADNSSATERGHRQPLLDQHVQEEHPALSYTDMLRKEDEQFMYLWMILLVLRVWGTSRFFLALKDPTKTVPIFDNMDRAFQSLQSVGDSSMALCNFFVFVLCDQPIRQGLVDFLLLRKRSTIPKTVR